MAGGKGNNGGSGTKGSRGKGKGPKGKGAKGKARKGGSGSRKKGRKAVDPNAVTAKSADKHALYQLAVQDTEHDLEYLQRVYEEARGKKALHLREDFCGTALLCGVWADQGEEYSAEGFDLDGLTLDWGREHNLTPLGAAASRVVLHAEDVRNPGTTPADICNAQNFSYQAFHARSDLIEYFQAVYRHLADDGLFVLDLYGGWEAVEMLEEERELDNGVVYVWDQVSYSPVTGLQKCAIHFKFPDGSKMRNAFVYDWRHWSMPELKECLGEVGFGRIDAYFEELDSDGDGTGVFEPSPVGHNCESWLAYLVAYK